ncbi:MAG: hypothetical protein CVV64_13825 [Candidatus Wallbacteria bacterium HGW-Wallbacteria-1]|jgi:DNA mismatch repair ATPase MutS|uniref:DNA mismatch repair proteins mutS family domain-containing protein n=1 Tax=Candidatus Wallbacteria bacterium HGW-Wallbacteria-1 TaxID=2013854 RepID=A0A2N1PMC8_9BACT|nr:MAG: hypothetical protein CVV64_13825 [Candidatus Wallbacteria bacterium HGW-Wallbacteria-1]
MKDTYFDSNFDDSAFYHVDDITAADLNLDELAEKLDSTFTTPGSSVFRYCLRHQCKSSSDLDERIFMESLFEADQSLRDSVQAILKGLGRQKIGDIADEIWGTTGDYFLKYINHFRIWMAVSLSMVGLSLIFNFYPILLIMLVAIVNICIHHRTTLYIGTHVESIRYLGSMKFACFKIKRLLGNCEVSERLAVPSLVRSLDLIPINPVLTFGNTAGPGDVLGVFLEYYKVFLLGELSSYFRFYSAFRTHRNIVEDLYHFLGHLDVACCVSRIRGDWASCSVHMIPSADCSDHVSKCSIITADMYNPLVENYVPISLSMNGDMMITGTNMSGKTTLLRTLGLNQVLATTFGFSFASEFRTSFFHVVSSIIINDDLLQGRSRYLAEAQRMLEIIRSAVNGVKLILIDEILTGTNNADRVVAAVNILSRLGDTDSLVMATTHDLEIATGVSGKYATHYFCEEMSDNDLKFDYSLKPGIVDRRNALKILEHLGFGDFINMDVHVA